MNKNQITDELLIYLISDENDIAFEYMLNRYKLWIERFIYAICKTNKQLFAYKDELLQEAWFAIINAIYKYDSNKVAVASAYIKTCVKNKVFTCRKKFLSDCSKMYEDNGYRVDYIEENQALYINDVIDTAVVNEKVEKFHKLLNKKEKQIIKLKLSGLTHKEIAKKLGVSLSKVYYQLNKMKSELIDYN